MYAFHTVSVAQSMYNNPVWFLMLGLLMLNLLLLLGILEIFGGPSSAEGTVRVAVREPALKNWVAGSCSQPFAANLQYLSLTWKRQNQDLFGRFHDY